MSPGLVWFQLRLLGCRFLVEREGESSLLALPHSTCVCRGECSRQIFAMIFMSFVPNMITSQSLSLHVLVSLGKQRCTVRALSED